MTADGVPDRFVAPEARRIVTDADRDLVLALRSELAAIEPTRPCDRRAEAAALVDVAVPRDSPIARLLFRLARERAMIALPPLPDGSPIAAFDWDGAAEHCRLAWLRGLFLAHGSLSLSGGRTHLEFVVAGEDAAVLSRRLADLDLPASWRVRRGRGVVTWKKGDLVGTFLRRIGAGAALLEVEVRQVSRALRGDLNRVLNAESANLQRAVGAAGRQIAAIDELTASGELGAQPYVVRLVAEARRETPESTLGELAERLGLHRSAVQRSLERIERLALTPDEDRRPGRRPVARHDGLATRRGRTRRAPTAASIDRPLA